MAVLTVEFEGKTDAWCLDCQGFRKLFVATLFKASAQLAANAVASGHDARFLRRHRADLERWSNYFNAMVSVKSVGEGVCYIVVVSGFAIGKYGLFVLFAAGRTSPGKAAGGLERGQRLSTKFGQRLSGDENV